MENKPPISLSTCWLQKRHKDGYAMLCDAAELGFEYVELGHSTPLACVEGILRALEEGVVKVSSLHNFCPLPAFAFGPSPNLYSPATKSKLESSQWLRHTRNTLDFAKRTKARAVVCHMGRLIYFFCDPSARLANMIEKDADAIAKLQEDKKYLALKDRFVKSASKKSLKAYAHIAKNLEEIGKEFEEAGVLIGMENRDNLGELPLDWNFGELMELCKPFPAAKIWHDIGHSKIKELYGICAQEKLIEDTLEHICGWHVHDCTNGAKDHLALGRGDVDFGRIKKYFDREKHLFVLEMSASVTREEIVSSKKILEDLLA